MDFRLLRLLFNRYTTATIHAHTTARPAMEPPMITPVLFGVEEMFVVESEAGVAVCEG